MTVTAVDPRPLLEVKGLHMHFPISEGILMRRGEAVPDPSGLAGKRIAAIRASANYNLASSFDGAEVIEFESEHVYEDMLAALRSGRVDAVCDEPVRRALKKMRSSRG